MSSILTADDLKRITGYDTDGGVRRALEREHILYFLGKGGAPWTTIDLVNAAKGLRADNKADQLGAEILGP